VQHINLGSTHQHYTKGKHKELHAPNKIRCYRQQLFKLFCRCTVCPLITVGIQLNSLDIPTHAIKHIQQQLQIPMRVWKLGMKSCRARSMTRSSEGEMVIIMHYNTFMTTLTLQTEARSQHWNPRTHLCS
jgi:hypothetical protein